MKKRMGYYIGIDGGGTKTAFAIADQEGNIVGNYSTTGTSYKEIGYEKVVRKLEQGISGLLEGSGILKKDVVGFCYGMPCYGESKVQDEIAVKAIKDAFYDIKVHIVNDVEVGWAGSLAMQEGINIVAGTGSIAYGKDHSGKGFRSGGWSEVFSDEGSCYWLAKKTLGLFAKQADGRAPRGALYELFMEKFDLTDPYDLIDIVDREYIPVRDKLASLQIILEKAALAGDRTAVKAYESAVEELVDTILAVKNALDFEGEVKVSYSGGLFKAGDLVLTPMKEQLAKSGCTMLKPLLAPVYGAVLLAISQFGGEHLAAASKNMVKTK